MEADGRQTIYVVGFPKCGGTWLSRLLGDALDSPVGAVFPPTDGKAIATEGLGRPGVYFIRQGHAVPIPGKFDGTVVPRLDTFAYENLTDEKVVFIMRDPRDIVVSGAHHWGFDDLGKYIEHVARGTWPMAWGDGVLDGGLVAFFRAWLDSGLLDVITSYETLSAEPLREVTRILDVLGANPVHPLGDVIERQSFKARRAWTEKHGDTLNYGRAFQLRFLRKGIVGDWVNVLTEHETQLVQECFGALMVELGYLEAVHV